MSGCVFVGYALSLWLLFFEAAPWLAAIVFGETVQWTGIANIIAAMISFYAVPRIMMAGKEGNLRFDRMIFGICTGLVLAASIAIARLLYGELDETRTMYSLAVFCGLLMLSIITDLGNSQKSMPRPVSVAIAFVAATSTIWMHLC